MKHSHYRRDVRHLDTIDIYRVLQLFGVTDPCLQHAAKKLLCAGQRGAIEEMRARMNLTPPPAPQTNGRARA